MANDPLHRLTGPPTEGDHTGDSEGGKGNGNSWARRLKLAMDKAPFDRLTPRELEVIELVAQGKSNKEIARALCITSHTAKAHLHGILHKLGVETRTEAAVLWARIAFARVSPNPPDPDDV